MLEIHALQRRTWYPVHLSAEAMNAISILRSDQIGSKLQSESARELSGYVSDGIDIYWNDVPGKFTHRDAAKRRTKISPFPECIWPQSRCGRDVEISNINTYGKISANNCYNPVTGQIVPAELNMHESVHFDDAMERQSPQWNQWILWSHMHSDQNYVIKKYSKPLSMLRLGKLLSLIFFSCSWRWVNNDSWA